MGARKALKQTYKLIKKSKLAIELGVAYQTIDRWIEINKMPCSEYTTETRYSVKIEKITKGKVTVEDLLGWRPEPLKKNT